MGVESSCLFRWACRERVDLVLLCILLVYLFRTRWQPDKQQDDRRHQRRRPIREEDQVRPLGLAEQGEQAAKDTLTDDGRQEFDERKT